MKIKNYKIRLISGDTLYVVAERVITDYELKILNFYTEDDLVCKILISQIIYVGLVKSDEVKEAEQKICL